MLNNESPIAQSRAEELGFDLWENFVVPPFYDSLDLLTAKRSRIIMGGRGCGKTMLLRYLCHDSQFSPKRVNISKENLTHIGLYWKIDTQFAKLLSQRGLDQIDWQCAFEHMATILLSIETLKSLENISKTNLEELDSDFTKKLDFNILNSFRKDIPNTFLELKSFLKREYNKFQTWVNSIKKTETPIFLPKGFLIELINEVKTQNDNFKNTNYFVYIDEYENALIEQQKLINTWIKHSEMPLIFNIAMKRNSFNERNTIGNEQIVDKHDFRIYDLESYFNEVIRFDVYASEILFLRLSPTGYKNSPINPTHLRSTSKEILNLRRSSDYRIKIINQAKILLPSFSQEELAKEVFRDPVLLNRLKEAVLKGLKYRLSQLDIKDLILEEFPEASVVITCLLYRDISDEDLLSEIKKLKENIENKFTGKTAWVHNNFIGCLLLLYEPLGRVCPFYSGFEAFCQMSNTNIRHFLELCNKSFINEILTHGSTYSDIISINYKNQSEAAKSASISFLKEVKSFGNNGNALHSFVLKIGTYFKFINKRPSQSEPEINHFSIKDTLDSKVDIQSFINDAVKWSVLYECKITKQKGGTLNLQSDNFEYVLNPIYAPYFHISFRKKRRKDLNKSDLDVFIHGSLKEFETYINKAVRTLKIEKNETLNLFNDSVNNED